MHFSHEKDLIIDDHLYSTVYSMNFYCLTSLSFNHFLENVGYFLLNRISPHGIESNIYTASIITHWLKIRYQYTVTGHWWQFMTIYDSWWQFIKFCDNSWKFMSLREAFKKYMEFSEGSFSICFLLLTKMLSKLF